MEQGSPNPRGQVTTGLAFNAGQYIVDRWQRAVLFWDVMRKRGNNYLTHLEEGLPPVLAYPYEMICDGRKFRERPVNYALVQIVGDNPNRVDPQKRPIIVVDPRAGHGPGIGGSKKDSEIGAALRNGRPTYFILFYPEPMPGQTIADIEKAEELFVQEVSRRHPEAPPPTVIGNCQAGWAAALLGARRPGISGPLVLAGSPLSYWAGEVGFNTMRYRGGLFGGSWLTYFSSDLGGGKFDGAHLVAGFEDLNPANTYWKKEYNLYKNVDTEEERYLNFDKWWSGYYYMNGEEIEFIVDNLFVGNKLQTGKLSLDPQNQINLRNLQKPVIVFASQGDNITPPMQALNWIQEVYGSVDEIRRQQKILIYLLHREIGHLGIFVSSSVGKKEHREIIRSIDQVGFLPPGLYEMVIAKPTGVNELNVEYQIRFEEREIEDILRLDDGQEDEKVFERIVRLSNWNRDIYLQFWRPWVRGWVTEQGAEVLRQLHPLRVSRYGFSDRNPFMIPVAWGASMVRDHRMEIGPDNPFVKLESNISEGIASWLDCYRTLRDDAIEYWVNMAYDNPWMNMYLKVLDPSYREPAREEIPTEEKRRALKQRETEMAAQDRLKWEKLMNEGGFVEAVLRIIAAVGSADHVIDKREIKEAFKIVGTHPKLMGLKTEQYKKIVAEQSRILQTDRDQALRALPSLLSLPEEREEAFRIAGRLACADRQMAPEELELLHQIKGILNIVDEPKGHCAESN